MANFTQESRLLELNTPIGKDKLLIRSINGTEGISQLFSFRVECFAKNVDVVDFSFLELIVSVKRLVHYDCHVQIITVV